MRVFGLFRNPVSYINPLLQRFSEITDFFVAFCVNKPHNASELKGINYAFLSGADDPGKWDGNDSRIIQPEVNRYIMSGKYDLVFINNSYTSPTTWIAILAARRKGIPIITRMTAGLSNKKSIFVMAAKRIIVSLYCSMVDAALYECRDQRDYCLEYGMKQEQLFFAPSVVDNDFFYSQKQLYKKDEVRAELGIANTTTVLIYTGRLIPLKRIFDTIYAVEKLIGEGYDVKFLIIGEGEEKDSISSYIKTDLLRDRIILCGGMDHYEMSKYLCASDIYVLASERDKSPKALSEAMNFELPILISNRVNNSYEMCENGVNGYIFEKGNVDHLHKLLKELLDHRDILQAMGVKSREIVSRYTFEGVTKAWLDAAKYALGEK